MDHGVSVLPSSLVLSTAVSVGSHAKAQRNRKTHFCVALLAVCLAPCIICCFPDRRMGGGMDLAGILGFRLKHLCFHSRCFTLHMTWCTKVSSFPPHPTPPLPASVPFFVNFPPAVENSHPPVQVPGEPRRLGLLQEAGERAQRR